MNNPEEAIHFKISNGSIFKQYGIWIASTWYHTSELNVSFGNYVQYMQILMPKCISFKNSLQIDHGKLTLNHDLWRCQGFTHITSYLMFLHDLFHTFCLKYGPFLGCELHRVVCWCAVSSGKKAVNACCCPVLRIWTIVLAWAIWKKIFEISLLPKKNPKNQNKTKIKQKCKFVIWCFMLIIISLLLSPTR